MPEIAISTLSGFEHIVFRKRGEIAGVPEVFEK